MDYTRAHDVASLVQYATDKVNESRDNVGCQLSGSLTVNRLLGNFHVKAGSDSPRVGPAAANLG